nr:alpha/beta hydrolase [Isoptericola halotolerans]
MRGAGWWAADYAYAVRRQLAGLMSRTRPETYSRLPAARQPPVLLVPGVYESWRFLEPLARALHGRGYAVHVVAPLGLNRGSIPDMTDLVAAALVEEDLTAAVVVAHSKGGLIGKSLMGRADVGHRISGMVAVNTPFAGSPYARCLPLRSVRDFLPHDEVITALDAQRADNARIVSAATFFDPHVPTGSRLPGATNVRLATPGHFRALADPELLPLLVRELERFAVARPDPGPAR